MLAIIFIIMGFEAGVIVHLYRDKERLWKRVEELESNLDQNWRVLESEKARVTREYVRKDEIPSNNGQLDFPNK